MQNTLNENQTTESEAARQARRARRARRRRLQNAFPDLRDEVDEPLITIQTTILSFVLMVVFLTPILITCYATIYLFATEFNFLYKMFVYPMLPPLPRSILTSCFVSYLNTFFLIVLLAFIIVVWRTTYYTIRLFIQYVESGDFVLF